MDVIIGDVVKVRTGYTCFIGCNIKDSGQVLKVTDSNLNILQSQSHKLEKHVQPSQAELNIKSNKKTRRKKNV